MDRAALFFYHTHTPESNRFEAEVRDLEIDSHATDYLAVARRLPPDVDAVFVKTDHWKTDPSYFDRLERRLSDAGAAMCRFDAHCCFTVAGSSVTVINGVEASLEDERKHVVIGGLPLTDDGTYHELTLEELLTAGENAGWIAPAHVGMPLHRFSRRRLLELVEAATAVDVPVGLGYATGYFPTYNRLCRNEILFRNGIREYALAHDVSLLPELDLHAAVPAGYAGCGVLSGTTITRLEDGTLPIGGLFDAELFQPRGVGGGITMRQFLENYRAFLPFVPSGDDYGERFERSLPSREWLASREIHTETVPLP